MKTLKAPREKLAFIDYVVKARQDRREELELESLKNTQLKALFENFTLLGDATPQPRSGLLKPKENNDPAQFLAPPGHSDELKMLVSNERNNDVKNSNSEMVQLTLKVAEPSKTAVRSESKKKSALFMINDLSKKILEDSKRSPEQQRSIVVVEPGKDKKGGAGLSVRTMEADEISIDSKASDHLVSLKEKINQTKRDEIKKKIEEEEWKIIENAYRKAKLESAPKKKMFDNQHNIKAKQEVADDIARVLLREDDVPSDRKFYALMTSKMRSNELGGMIDKIKYNIELARVEAFKYQRRLDEAHRVKKDCAKCSPGFFVKDDHFGSHDNSAPSTERKKEQGVIRRQESTVSIGNRRVNGFERENSIKKTNIRKIQAHNTQITSSRSNLRSSSTYFRSARTFIRSPMHEKSQGTSVVVKQMQQVK